MKKQLVRVSVIHLQFPRTEQKEIEKLSVEAYNRIKLISNGVSLAGGKIDPDSCSFLLRHITVIAVILQFRLYTDIFRSIALSTLRTTGPGGNQVNGLQRYPSHPESKGNQSNLNYPESFLWSQFFMNIPQSHLRSVTICYPSTKHMHENFARTMSPLLLARTEYSSALNTNQHKFHDTNAATMQRISPISSYWLRYILSLSEIYSTLHYLKWHEDTSSVQCLGLISVFFSFSRVQSSGVGRGRGQRRLISRPAAGNGAHCQCPVQTKERKSR